MIRGELELNSLFSVSFTLFPTFPQRFCLKLRHLSKPKIICSQITAFEYQHSGDLFLFFFSWIVIFHILLTTKFNTIKYMDGWMDRYSRCVCVLCLWNWWVKRDHGNWLSMVSVYALIGQQLLLNVKVRGHCPWPWVGTWLFTLSNLTQPPIVHSVTFYNLQFCLTYLSFKVYH